MNSVETYGLNLLFNSPAFLIINYWHNLEHCPDFGDASKEHSSEVIQPEKLKSGSNLEVSTKSGNSQEPLREYKRRRQNNLEGNEHIPVVVEAG